MCLSDLVMCYLAMHTVTGGRIVRSTIGQNASLSFTINTMRHMIMIRHENTNFRQVWTYTNFIRVAQPDRVSVLVDNKTASNTIMGTVNILNITKKDIGMYSVVDELKPLDSLLLLLDTIGVDHTTSNGGSLIVHMDVIEHYTSEATLLTEETEGTGITSKFVCPGESVQLFKITNFDSCNAVVSLLVHGYRITQIAKWTWRNCTLNSSLLPEYKNKVYFNTNETILIHDVHPWDERRYIMRNEDTLPMTYEELIYVMELQTTECRPTILHLGNFLSVSLKHDVCGKPLATPYWRDFCGVSYSEACTCYDSIVSTDLKCARNSTSLDYSSTFIKGGTGTTPVSFETMNVKTIVFIAVGISLVFSFLLVIIMITILRHRKRRITVRRIFKKRRTYFDSEDDGKDE